VRHEQKIEMESLPEGNAQEILFFALENIAYGNCFEGAGVYLENAS